MRTATRIEVILADRISRWFFDAVPVESPNVLTATIDLELVHEATGRVVLATTFGSSSGPISKACEVADAAVDHLRRTRLLDRRFSMRVPGKPSQHHDFVLA